MKLPFPVGKIKAQANTLFVGKTHVLLHRSDVRLDNLMLTEVEHMDEEEVRVCDQVLFCYVLVWSCFPHTYISIRDNFFFLIRDLRVFFVVE